MKNSSTLLSIMGATFAVLCLTVSADAKKVGDWTCSDFLKASSSQKEKMVYFFQGIKLSDKKEALDLAAQDFNVPVSKVVQHGAQSWRGGSSIASTTSPQTVFRCRRA